MLAGKFLWLNSAVHGTSLEQVKHMSWTLNIRHKYDVFID